MHHLLSACPAMLAMPLCVHKGAGNPKRSVHPDVNPGNKKKRPVLPGMVHVSKSHFTSKIFYSFKRPITDNACGTMHAAAASCS